METFEIDYTFTVKASDLDEAINNVEDLLFCGEEHSEKGESVTDWKRQRFAAFDGITGHETFGG